MDARVRRDDHVPGAPVQVDTLPWYLRVLQVLTNPDLVFLLLLIGMVGLMIEVLNPGGIIPGAVGLIAVLLGIAGMSALPFNWIGVALLVVGVGLLFAETQVPGFGALAGAGSSPCASPAHSCSAAPTRRRRRCGSSSRPPCWWVPAARWPGGGW